MPRFAKCTYCGGLTIIEHKVFEGSCLCAKCADIDDLTYYHHKWMLMSEADALEAERIKTESI